MVRDLFESFTAKYKNRLKAKFAKTAQIDSKSIFEGSNFVGKNAVVKMSSLGRGSYVAFSSEIVRCKVGRYTCIGPNVSVISGKHPVAFASMHPFFYSVQNQIGKSYVNCDKFEEHDYIDNGDYYIEIGNDVWIGNSVKIMAGLKIGNGAVIAAGAVVTTNIPDYAIVGGVPAKLIKYRFPEEIMLKLNRCQWWDMEESELIKFADLFSNVEIMLNTFYG